jgi:hypothetical protein
MSCDAPTAIESKEDMELDDEIRTPSDASEVVQVRKRRNKMMKKQRGIDLWLIYL